MSNTNIVPSERATPVVALSPVQQAAGTVSTAWMSMVDFQWLRFALLIGAIAAGGTLDAKIEQATADDGSGTKDVDGKAIAQVDDTGGQTQKVLSVNAEDLDVNADYAYVRLTVTVANAAIFIAALGDAFDGRYQPLEAPASVTETVE